MVTKGRQTYTFDPGKRLALAHQGASYAYDGHGRRTKAVSNEGSTRIQVYSQGGQLLWSERSAVGPYAATTTYSCSTGTVESSQCVSTSNCAASAGTSCNAGDRLIGSTCTHTTELTGKAAPTSKALPGSDVNLKENLRD